MGTTVGGGGNGPMLLGEERRNCTLASIVTQQGLPEILGKVRIQRKVTLLGTVGVERGMKKREREKQK